MAQVKVPYPDEQNPSYAEEVDVRTTHAEANVYELSDGTTLKLHTTIRRVYRVIGAYNSEGHPLYYVEPVNTMTVDAPTILLRKGGH